MLSNHVRAPDTLNGLRQHDVNEVYVRDAAVFVAAVASELWRKSDQRNVMEVHLELRRTA